MAAALPLGVEVVTEADILVDLNLCLLCLVDPDSGLDCVDEAELEEALEDDEVKGCRVGWGLQVGSGW